MVSTALQFLVVILSLLPSLPLIEQSIHGGTVGWDAFAHVCVANRYSMTIGLFYGIELMCRFIMFLFRRPLGFELAWSCAVVHFILASVVLICLGCDLVEAPSVSSFRDRLWGMQCQLAIAGLSLTHAIREFIHFWRHRAHKPALAAVS